MSKSGGNALTPGACGLRLISMICSSFVPNFVISLQYTKCKEAPPHG